MTDPTLEKWQELADKLSAELADTDELLALRRRVWKRMLLAGVIALCGLGAAIAFASTLHSNYHMIVVGPFVAFLAFVGFLMLRVRRLIELTVADGDRIRADIRAWKKRKPAAPANPS